MSYRQVQCYPPFSQVHSDFGDFNNGLCHVMKITIAESNLAFGLRTQYLSYFVLDIRPRELNIAWWGYSGLCF